MLSEPSNLVLPQHMRDEWQCRCASTWCARTCAMWMRNFLVSQTRTLCLMLHVTQTGAQLAPAAGLPLEAAKVQLSHTLLVQLEASSASCSSLCEVQPSPRPSPWPLPIALLKLDESFSPCVCKVKGSGVRHGQQYRAADIPLSWPIR